MKVSYPSTYSDVQFILIHNIISELLQELIRSQEKIKLDLKYIIELLQTKQIQEENCSNLELDILDIDALADFNKKLEESEFFKQMVSWIKKY